MIDWDHWREDARDQTVIWFRVRYADRENWVLSGADDDGRDPLDQACERTLYPGETLVAAQRRPMLGGVPS